MRTPLRNFGLVTTAAVVVVSTAPAVAARLPAASNGAAAPAANSTVQLVTGDTVAIGSRGAKPTLAVHALRHSGIGAQFTTFHSGTVTYVIPGAARRYLGTVLDPSLFDVQALAGGPTRLPVTVVLSTAGARPAAPGLVLTSRSGVHAHGYLDPAQSREFGAALIGQWTADAVEHRAPTSIMDGLAHLAVAGATPPVRPHFPQVTLNLTALDTSGRLAHSAVAGLINVDDARKFAGFVYIRDGHAKVSVPKGHYSLIGEFDEYDGKSLSTQIVPVPDFAVTTHQQLFVIDARKATVTPSVSTPRPAALVNLSLELDRATALNSISLAFAFGPGDSVRIAPAATSPYGTTDYLVGWQLAATPASGNPYTYDLSFHTAGQVPANQHRTIPGWALATVHARYHADHIGTGLSGRLPLYPFQASYSFTLHDLVAPQVRTEYVNNPVGAVWSDLYSSPSPDPADPSDSDTVRDGYRLHPAGQDTTVDWLAGALAPGLPAPQSGDTQLTCFTCRDAHHLSIALLPVSDSDPGHSGFPGGSPRLRVWRDGTSVVDVRDYRADVAVPVGAATYRVREDVDRSAYASLSTHSSTDVTFGSASGGGAPLPDGWTCHFGEQCTVVPMLTARVALPTDLLGTAPQGKAAITFTVSHAPGATPSEVTSARLQYAVDARGWSSTPVTSLGGGRYRVAIAAPGGSTVSLRVSAHDTAGGSIVQTVSDAYRVATS